MAFDPSSATIESQGFDASSATMESSFDPGSAAMEESPTPATDAATSGSLGDFLGDPGKYLWRQTPEAKQVAEGVRTVLGGLVPTSLKGAAEFATPAVGAVEDISRGATAAVRVAQGQPIDQINREFFPEAFRYENFGQMPLQQKVATVGGDVANLAMGALIGKGLVHGAAPETPAAAPEPVAPEPVAPRGPVPIEAQIGGEKYAQRTRTETQAPGIQEEFEPGAEGRVRVRDTEEDRLAAQPPEAGAGEAPIAAPQEAVAPAPEIPQPAHYTQLSEPAVTVGEQRTTSTKNAVVDAEREARGLSPIQGDFSQTHPELWNQVQTKFEADPLYGKKVVDGLLQDPARGITPFDEAALLREKVRVQNLREAAGDRADDASLEDWQRKEARDDYDRHEAYANDIDRATYRSGEVWGQFGNFRQRLALDDYSLEAMKRRTRVAKKGPLTLEESQELEKDTAAVADLTKQRNKRLQTLEEEQAVKRVQRRERLEQRIAQEKGLEPMRIKGQPVPPDVEIEILLDEMSKLKALKKERGRLPAAKEQTRKRIAEINQRMKDYGFSKLLKAEKLTPDKELLQLQYDLFQATGKLERGINAQKFKSMGKAMQAAHMSREILALPRQLMASTDFSAVLRQGGIFATTHPIKALRATGAMFRATATEKGYFAEMQKIRDRDNSWKYFRDGLELTDIHPRTRAGAEEPFQGVLGERIPVVSHSQRAYTLYLNRIRADWYDYMEKYLAGSEATPGEGKVIANAVNVMTGRGAVSGPRVLQGLAALNDLFFAPRWRISRFQTLLGQPLWTPKGGYAGTGRARALVASEYAKTLLAYGGIMAMLSTVGKQTIEGEPISSDFGKIKIGNTRIDLLPGVQQPFVMMNRLFRGKTKRLSGEVRPLYGTTGYKDRTALAVVADYVRSGFAPVPGKITDVLAGSDLRGKPVTAFSTFVYPGILPLTVTDIHEAMLDLGAPAGAATGLASIFGAGVQTYETRPTTSTSLYRGQGKSLYQPRSTKLYR